jgi:hypothetical protein
MEFLLSIELVPETSWGRNFRSHLTQYQWQKLSQHVIKEANNTCEICKRAKGEEFQRLHCHEVWEYDTENKIQKLVKLQSLCFLCHCVKHMGFVSTQEWIDRESIVEHFVKINNTTKPIFERHYKESMSLWRHRSKINWQVEFQNVLELYGEIIKSKKDKTKVLYDKVMEEIRRNPKASAKQLQIKFRNEEGIIRITRMARSDYLKESRLR